MFFTRLALYLCYAVTGAGLVVFLLAQADPQGPLSGAVAIVLPLALLAGIVIRSLHKRLARDDT